MATRIYRLLDGRGFTVNADGSVELPRHYMVVGPSSELDVRTAVDLVNGFILPRRGDQLAENPLLRVEEVSADWQDKSTDGDVWMVRITWRAGTIEGISVDEPLEYEWDEAEESVQVAEDKDRKPFLNSAGDPLEGSFGDAEPIIVLRVWRTEPLYDPSVEFSIRGAINSAALSLFGGAFTVDAEAMLCKQSKPTQKQRVGDTSTRVERVFWFRNNFRPWEPRAVDRGYNGWFGSPAKKGPFRLDKAEENYPDAVLLDGTGKPISSQFKVYDADAKTWETPVANPSVPSWFEIDPSSTSDGKVLVFSRKRTFDFTNLLPPIM